MKQTTLTVSLCLFILAAFAAPLFQTGCSTAPDGTTGGVTGIVTPARVEAVTALGAYYGSIELIRDGKADDLIRARAGLDALARAENRDLVAIAGALNAAGLAWMQTPEGNIAFALAVSIFADKYGPQTVLNNDYALAVLDGAIRGIDLALSWHLTRAPSDPDDRLAEAAKATRPGVGTRARPW